jgi:hypothetical protein
MPKSAKTAQPKSPVASAPFIRTQRGNEMMQRFQQSASYIAKMRARWDDAEAMHISKSLSKADAQNAVISKVNDGRLPTIALESTARVMAQMPTGTFQALTKADKGKSEIMQTYWDRYVLPHANSQFDLLTKLRMWNLYSKIYGSQAMFYDWRDDDDYQGPDCWLYPMRDFFPQPGKVSIQESDWVMLAARRSVSWVKSRKGLDGWNADAIDYLVEQANQTAKDPVLNGPERRSFIERNNFQSGALNQGDSAIVELVTCYESGAKGHWITYCPEFEWAELRDIPNPHENGKIPVILKHCIPLLDSIIGLGDYERGKTLQYARNSLLNLYLDSVKMGIMPPLMINTAQVDAPSSIQWSPAAKWQVKSPNAITPLAVSPQGLQTFQPTWDVLTAGLLNLQGTTDTAVSSNTDVGFGKTPQAIQAQQVREAARDNWDRFFMEQCIEELVGRMANLVPLYMDTSTDVPLLFPEEVKRIQEAYPDEDVVQVYDSEKAGMLKVNPKLLKGVKFNFSIDASSTLKQEQGEQHQALTEVINTFIQGAAVLQPMLQQEGYELNFGELMKQWMITSGFDDTEKILTKTAATSAGQQQPMQMTPDGVPAIPGINVPDPNHNPTPPPERMQPNFQDPAIAQAHQMITGGLSQ